MFFFFYEEISILTSAIKTIITINFKIKLFFFFALYSYEYAKSTPATRRGHRPSSTARRRSFSIERTLTFFCLPCSHPLFSGVSPIGRQLWKVQSPFLFRSSFWIVLRLLLLERLTNCDLFSQ